MWILISAVATASFLGSMHCVGMCGPLAIWASGAGEGSPTRRIYASMALYHFGRMLTYLLAGLFAGFLGSLVDFGGEILGVQMVAAKLFGGLMIFFGLLRLWPFIHSQFGSLIGRVNPAGLTMLGSPRVSIGQRIGERINQSLIRLRPYVLSLPLTTRGITVGLLTAFLPCGWLYLFALVAAGTGSLWAGPLVMFAFWLGTVPALTGLVIGTQSAFLRLGKIVPAMAALLLIVGGCYTAAGRGFAQLSSLAEISPEHPDFSTASLLDDSATEGETVAEVNRLVNTPLPCCEHLAAGHAAGASTNSSEGQAVAPSTGNSDLEPGSCAKPDCNAAGCCRDNAQHCCSESRRDSDAAP